MEICLEGKNLWSSPAPFFWQRSPLISVIRGLLILSQIPQLLPKGLWCLNSGSMKQTISLMKWKFYIGYFLSVTEVALDYCKKKKNVFFFIKQYRSEWNRYDPLHQFEVQLPWHLFYFPIITHRCLLRCGRKPTSYWSFLSFLSFVQEPWAHSEISDLLLPNKTLSPVKSWPLFSADFLK